MNKDAEPVQLNSPWPADSYSVFQTALDSLPNLFYLLDEQGRFVHWNLKSIEVTGYSDKEHLQMDILGLFAGKDQEHISNRMIEVFTKGEASAEAELVTKLGDKIPYYFTGKRIEVNGKVYLSGLGTNISERKELEKNLNIWR